MQVKQNDIEIPVFQVRMHFKDKKLVEMVRDGLDLDELNHEYTHQNRHYVLFTVRKRKTISEKLIPLLDGRLFGLKRIQFEIWKKKFEIKKENGYINLFKFVSPDIKMLHVKQFIKFWLILNKNSHYFLNNGCFILDSGTRISL